MSIFVRKRIEFMDVLTGEQRRRNMQAIKCKGTKMEILFAKALWANGIRYRKNDSSVFGKPDLTVKKHSVAIFIDSEYFHGKNWETEKYRIKTNRDFWWKKIESNMMRDIEVNRYLSENGWKVLRFWSKDINKNINLCVEAVIMAICNKRDD